jgi:hypothetical protein
VEVDILHLRVDDVLALQMKGSTSEDQSLDQDLVKRSERIRGNVAGRDLVPGRKSVIVMIGVKKRFLIGFL